MRTQSMTLVIIVLAASALAAAAPPPAAAQGVFVCVANKDGAMRYLGAAPGPCLKQETLVSLPLQGPAGPQGPPGPPGDVGDLPQRVAALESSNKWAHFSAVVDCAAGGSVAAALHEAAAYASAEIGIKGVCQGGVAITSANTQLYGVGDGDGLTLSGQPLPVVEIAAANVRLTNLALTGGYDGLTVGGGHSVDLWRTTIASSERHGIFVAGGQVTLRESAVTGAGGTGVLTRAGAIVSMGRSSIRHAANDGLLLQASRAFIDNESAIESNGGNGILLYSVSSADLGVATIAGNGAGGVTVKGASSVHVTGTAITGNTRNGIQLDDTGVATLWGGEITGNGGWGVYCDIPPSVGQISGNIAPGVVIDRNILGNVMPRCTYPL